MGDAAAGAPPGASAAFGACRRRSVRSEGQSRLRNLEKFLIVTRLSAFEAIALKTSTAVSRT